MISKQARKRISESTTRLNHERWGHKFYHFTILKGKISFTYRKKNYKFSSWEDQTEWMKEQGII